jgi:tetratricopeptide (TPR) repeat protein
VADASLPVLSALVDQSLLKRLPSGRYQIHGLLRQYARQKLAGVPGEEDRARDRHCRAYAGLLRRYQRGPQSVAHGPILERIGQDVENVRAAWYRAIRQQDHEAVDAMQAALADYCHLTTSFQEGEALFRAALQDLAWPAVDQAWGLLTWRLRSSRATFSVYLGRFSEARADLEQCLAFFRQQGAVQEVARCRFFLGEIARFEGEHVAAGHLFEQSLAGYRRVGDLSAVGFCLNGLGLVSAALGELPRARSWLQSSLAAFVETGHEMGRSIVSINLANLLSRLGDYAKARAILDEAYTLCQRLGHRWGMAVCLRRLGDIARHEDRTEQAKTAYRQSLEILQDIGQRQATAGCLIELGRVCADLDEGTEARQHLEAALSLSVDLQDRTQMAEAAASLAVLLAGEGDVEIALVLATLVERHPAAGTAAREAAGRLAARLALQLAPETVRRIRNQAEAGTLEAFVADPAHSILPFALP